MGVIPVCLRRFLQNRLTLWISRWNQSIETVLSDGFETFIAERPSSLIPILAALRAWLLPFQYKNTVSNIK